MHRHNDSHAGNSAFQVVVNLIDVVDVGDRLEVVGAGIVRDQLPALLCIVQVADNYRDIPYIHRCRIAEKDKLQYRSDEKHAEHSLIAPQLEEFFFHDSQNSFDIHLRILSCSI